MILQTQYTFLMSYKQSVGSPTIRLVLAPLMLIVPLITTAAIASLPPLKSYMTNNSDSVGGFLVGTCFALAITCLVFIITYCTNRFLDKSPLTSLGLRWDKTITLWVVAILIVATIIKVFTIVFAHFTLTFTHTTGDMHKPVWMLIAGAFFTGFFVQAIPEELIFRGWLIASLGGKKYAFWASVILFTAIHIISSGGQQNIWEHVLYLVLPAGFAYSAALVWVITGSEWPAIAVHGRMHMAGIIPTLMAEDDTIWAVVIKGILWICVDMVIHYRYHQRLPC